MSLAVVAVAFPQSMKMVVDSAGNVVSRYVRTNDSTYTYGRGAGLWRCPEGWQSCGDVPG